MIVICTGIPGVGKTTVMEKGIALLARQSIPCLLVTYGTVMLEVAISEKVVSDRDQLRRLPTETQRTIQKKAAEYIAKMADGKNVIVDTHSTIKTAAGYFPGLPRWVLDELKPSAIVLVEAPPEEIYARRVGDPTRLRDADSLEEIKTHQMMNRMYASAYSTHCGGCVKIIENRQSQVEKAASDFARTLEG